MSTHPRPWLARLSCTHATPTSVAATPGNWLSCGTCHTQEPVTSVSRALAAVPEDGPLVQLELFTVAEIRRAA